MHYFSFEFIRVNNAATAKADRAATIIYALKGIELKPIVATIPDTNITIIFLNFLKSLINRAKNVNEIVKLNPNSSGTTEPKTIPRIVDICQIVQQVKPAPNKWKCLFSFLRLFLKYVFETAKA